MGVNIVEYIHDPDLITGLLVGFCFLSVIFNAVWYGRCPQGIANKQKNEN